MPEYIEIIEGVYAVVPTPAELHAAHYRWWRVMAWRSGDNVGVKLGPLSVWWYRFYDNERRVSWSWLGGDEHVALSW